MSTASAAPTATLSALDQRRLDAHTCSLKTFLRDHRAALARFHKTGDLAEQEWAAKYLHAAKIHAEVVSELGGTLPEAPELQPAVEEAPVEAEAPVAPPQARCAFYKHIRRFMAVAREHGLDISEAARDRMRGAIGMLLGRRIESRSDLTGPDWELCINALRTRRLFW